MGTEVLLPQDILGSRRLGGFGPSTATAAASFLPRRKQTPSSCSSSAAATAGGPGANPRLRRRAEPRRRREGSPKPAGKISGGGCGSSGGVVMGQVTILRRGESLDSVAGRGLPGKVEKEGRRGEGVVLSSEAGGDLIVFGTGRLGPEPAAVPRQTRLVGVKTVAKEASRVEKYAGPAFSLSPSPRALPLPTFPSRKPGEGGGAATAAHQSATRDLRRLLRLD